MSQNNSRKLIRTCVFAAALSLGTAAFLYPPWISRYAEDELQLTDSAERTPRIELETSLGYAPLWSPPKSQSLGRTTIDFGRLFVEMSGVGVFAAFASIVSKEHTNQ